MPKFCRQRFILLIYPYATERAITYVHLSPPPSLPLRGGDPWQAFSPGAPRFQLNKKSGRIRAGKRYVQSNVLELINGDKEGRAD